MNFRDYWEEENTEEKLSERNLSLIPSKEGEYSGTTDFPHLKIQLIGSFCNAYIDSFCDWKQLLVSEKLLSSIRTPFKLLMRILIFPVNICALASVSWVSYCSFVFLNLFSCFIYSLRVKEAHHHTFNFFRKPFWFMNAPLVIIMK